MVGFLNDLLELGLPKELRELAREALVDKLLASTLEDSVKRSIATELERETPRARFAEGIATLISDDHCDPRFFNDPDYPEDPDCPPRRTGSTNDEGAYQS
jgi:hypothetical protein